jgi:hypothetical protein
LVLFQQLGVVEVLETVYLMVTLVVQVVEVKQLVVLVLLVRVTLVGLSTVEVEVKMVLAEVDCLLVLGERVCHLLSQEQQQSTRAEVTEVRHTLTIQTEQVETLMV